MEVEMPKICTISRFDGFAAMVQRRRKRMPAWMMAEKLGVSRAMLSLWENNHRPMPADVAEAIARELGVSLDSLRFQVEIGSPQGVA